MKSLYLKQVAFIGKFDNGQLLLRDVVYNADGTPVDKVEIFIPFYIEVSVGGTETKQYKMWIKHIENRKIITPTATSLSLSHKRTKSR